MPDSPSQPLSEEFISVVTYTTPSETTEYEESTRTSKGMLDDALSGTPRGGGGASSKAIGHVSISAKKLEDQMTQLLKSMGGVLSKAKERAGELAGMELDEVELSVEINGQGEVSLMGIGGIEAGASGAVKLKFVRKM